MSDYLFAAICSHSAALPAIIGLVRLRKIPGAYQPFLIFLWLGWLNEILSTILIYNRISNAVNANVYVLIEFLCMLVLFRNWGTSSKRFSVYRVIALVVSAIWLLDNIVLHDLNTTNSLYRLCYSLVLAFLSVDQISNVVFMERKRMFKNPKFIICSGLLIFFVFKALTESFFVFRLNLSLEFFSKFFLLIVLVNVLVNVLYTLAILWIPTKQNFSLRY